MTCGSPRSRGSQRQRSILTIMVSLASGGGGSRGGGRPAANLLFAFERPHGVWAKIAVNIDVRLGLERPHRLANNVVVERIVPVAGNVEPLAQRDDTLVPHARAQNLAVGHSDVLLLALFVGLGLNAAALAQFGKLGLERLEFGLWRIVTIKHLTGIARGGNLGQHVGRLRRDELEVDIGADTNKMGAAGLGMARLG